MAGNGIISADHTIFQQLMQISTIRGQDGTGIIQADFRGDDKSTFLIEKKPYEVNYFFWWVGTKDGNKFVLNSLNDNVYIGHVRDATRGDLTEANCHPFRSKSLIGVHNGTLDDFEFQDVKRSDSLLLYETIANKGAKKTLEELYPSSAYALNWIDTATEKIYFARNSKRPLHVTRSKDRAVVYWASEAGMLEYILDRNKVEYGKILYFKEHNIYTLDPNAISDKGETIPWNLEEYKPQTWEDLPASKHSKSKRSEYYDMYNEWGRTWGYGADDWDDDKYGTAKPSRYSATAANTKSNVKVEVPLLSNISKKVGKIPHETCFGCHEELSLVDQYMSDKVPVDGRILYECQACINLEISLKGEKRALQ